jgi:hypothetical protein
MKKINLQSGVILPTLMISTVVVFAVVLVVSQTVVENYKTVVSEQYRVNAQFAADSAVDYAITQINQDVDWAGITETELFNNGESRTTYEVEVTDIDDDSKEVSVVGRTYQPTSDTEPSATRSVTVELYAVTGSGSGGASVVTGVGGLTLTNNAKIVAGDVFVNGTITLNNNAQIGTSSNPVNVRVAHQSCPVPPGTTYPVVCGPGENGEPITITNSAQIYGSVQATNQTNGASMTNPGLEAGAPTPSALPTHDRSAQIAAVANTMTGAAASCSSGTRNIPANTRINGNVSWSNTCRITINGDMYVTGNMTLSNSARATIAESVGTDRPDIMIDGSSGLNMSNNTQIIANSFDTGAQIVTYRSAASCSPNCPDVTGADLYNSRNMATITLNNSASAPETIFYAKWSQVNIVNAGNIGALIGQTVRLNNSAAVVFGASISGYGSSPPTWLVYSYRQG